MAALQGIIAGLRRAEQQLAKQLEGVRTAISSLELGGAVSPGFKGGSSRPQRAGGKRKRRKMSAEARAKIAAAQKKRWAKVKAASKG